MLECTQDDNDDNDDDDGDDDDDAAAAAADDDDDDDDDDYEDDEISLEKQFDRHVPISHSYIAIILQLFDKILIANRGEIACRVCNRDLGACDLSLHFYYILSLYMNFLFSFIFRS